MDTTNIPQPATNPAPEWVKENYQLNIQNDILKQLEGINLSIKNSQVELASIFNTKIDSLNSKIENIEASVNTKVNNQDNKILELEERLINYEQKSKLLENKINEINTRLNESYNVFDEEDTNLNQNVTSSATPTTSGTKKETQLVPPKFKPKPQIHDTSKRLTKNSNKNE